MYYKQKRLSIAVAFIIVPIAPTNEESKIMQNMQNMQNQEFVRYEGQSILVDPSYISKTLKIQRRIMVFAILVQPILIGLIIFSFFVGNPCRPSFNFIAIAPYIPIFIFVTLFIPFIMFRVFAWMFPKRFDPIARTMISMTPIIKPKKDISAIESIILENRTIQSGRHGSQEFIFVNGKTIDGKTINLFRFPGIASEEITPHIKSLANSMGWKMAADGQ